MNVTTQQPLLVETNGHVRILTMNRPAKKNALSNDLVEAIVEAVATLL